MVPLLTRPLQVIRNYSDATPQTQLANEIHVEWVLNFRLYAEVWMYHLQNKLLITQLHTSLSVHVNHTASELPATGLILTYFPRSVNNLNTASTRPRSVTLRSNCTDCMCVWQVCVCACVFVCACVCTCGVCT